MYYKKFSKSPSKKIGAFNNKVPSQGLEDCFGFPCKQYRQTPLEKVCDIACSLCPSRLTLVAVKSVSTVVVIGLLMEAVVTYRWDAVWP